MLQEATYIKQHKSEPKRRKTAALFKLASSEMDERIAKFVYDTILQYPTS
jgi:hypothetical protein